MKVKKSVVQIRQCVVRLDRLNMDHVTNGRIQTTVRRSKRLIMKQNGLQLPPPIAESPTPKKNAKFSRTIERNVSKSATKPLKSIIKTHTLRARSKSVSFDPAIVSPVKSTRRRLFSDLNDSPRGVRVQNLPCGSRKQLAPYVDGNSQDGPIDLTTKVASDVPPDGNSLDSGMVSQSLNGCTPVSIEDNVLNFSFGARQQSIETGSGSVVVQDETNIPSVTRYVEVETQEKDAFFSTTSEYDSRINSLIESNRLKIDRIKQLVADKSALLKDIDTAHNMNRSMAESIVAFRAEDGISADIEANVAELKSEIDSLRLRVDRANRENFDLIAENARMKSVFETYSKKVLKEHSYNI